MKTVTAATTTTTAAAATSVPSTSSSSYSSVVYDLSKIKLHYTQSLWRSKRDNSRTGTKTIQRIEMCKKEEEEEEKRTPRWAFSANDKYYNFACTLSSVLGMAIVHSARTHIHTVQPVLENWRRRFFPSYQTSTEKEHSRIEKKNFVQPPSPALAYVSRDGTAATESRPIWNLYS